jgi:fengycin family lipopeptide synthetase D
MESTLTDIWKEVLRLDKIGVNDNFFDLGANSMDVILLNNKLKETLNIDIPVISIYRYFTIKSFIDYLRKEESISVYEEEIDRMDEELEKSKRRLRQKSKRIRYYE